MPHVPCLPPAHLARVQAEAGRLVMAGASGAPVDGALFIFKGASVADIEAYVKADPYVINKLVTKHTIKPYTVVVGDTP
jgi:uncharacterized protein YciI